MTDCGPACAVPSFASRPVVGFGSAGSGFGHGGFGFGSSYGYGAGALAESSSNLGTLAGVIPSCINQIPAAEVVIQPPSSIVTIPGPILSASCEPVSVGGNTPCAVGGSGIARGNFFGGLGSGAFGFGYGLRGRGYLGSSFQGRRGSVCY